MLCNGLNEVSGVLGHILNVYQTELECPQTAFADQAG
jgi:hypothetical protein